MSSRTSCWGRGSASCGETLRASRAVTIGTSYRYRRTKLETGNSAEPRVSCLLSPVSCPGLPRREAHDEPDGAAGKDDVADGVDRAGHELTHTGPPFYAASVRLLWPSRAAWVRADARPSGRTRCA